MNDALGAADMEIFAAACGLVLAMTLLAGYIPACRAAKIDPMKALRCE